MNRRWIDVVRLRLRSLFLRQRVEAELDRELRAHLEAMVAENIDLGMPPDEARRVAARDFGGLEPMKEDTRDARGVNFVENLVRDLRHALRGLSREPLLLLAAVTSIAVGAAGNVAVFGLARELVFERPDVREPESVVAMHVSRSSHASYQRWRDLDASGAVENVTGYNYGSQVNWFRGDAAVSVSTMQVAPNFFDVLGVPLALGRAFNGPEASAENDPRLAVISHSFWRQQLGGDSAAIGTSLTLNGHSYTVIGVLARDVRSLAGFGIAPSIYLPLTVALVPSLLSPTAQTMELVGRLKPDQTVDEARAALDAVDRRLALALNDSLGGVRQFGLVGTVGDTKRRTLAIFFAMVGVVSALVLLIACANVAGLLMARAATRRSEIAIRLAIGGSRFRLVQQWMAEAFWLATIGTVAGLALAGIAMRAVNAMTLPIDMPVELNLTIDGQVLLGAVGLLLATMGATALLPALSVSRLSLTPALKREERVHATRRLTSRSVLLAGQVVVSTVLLVTAFLFVRNLQRSRETNPGFDIDPVLVAQIGLVRARAGGDQIALLERLAERARATPRVSIAAYSTSVPLTPSGGGSSGRSFHFDRHDQPRHVEYSRAEVGAGYFAALGIRQLGGRDFSSDDRLGGPKVVIVNDAFARRYVDGDAVGRRFRIVGSTTPPPEYQIVGVVANSKYPDDRGGATPRDVSAALTESAPG